MTGGGREDAALRVSADQGNCIGGGYCVLNAPAVFDQDETTGLVVVLDPEPDESRRVEVTAAARDCPSGAVRLERRALPETR